MDWIGYLGLGITFFGVNIQGINHLIKKSNKRAPVISFSNDEFARHTIKYRFKSILCDLNEQIEAVKLTGRSQKEKWLFDYDAFCRGIDFKTPHVLFEDLYKQYQEGFLKDLLDRYSGDKSFSSNKEFLEKAPFIDVEHFFYFYIYVKLFKEQNEEVKEFLCDVKESNEDIRCFFDPYKRIKRKSIEDDIKNKKSLIIAGLEVVNRIANNEYTLDENPNDLLEKIIIYSLNSNSYDLSQLHTTGRYKTETDNYDLCGAKGMIDFLGGSKKQRAAHYLVDNSGVELFLDLVLGYALLNMLHLRINKIVYHVNVLPVFVSDVIQDDIDYTLKIIERCIRDNQELSDMAEKNIAALWKIKGMLEDKRAVIEPNFIWNMPTPYEDISKYNRDLYNTVFANNDNLLIVKGDLNYRRLCRDRAWKNTNKTSSLDYLTRYIQTPTLVIRCFKSNVILDVEEDRVMKRDREDWDWRTNGKYGVIKFMSKD